MKKFILTALCLLPLSAFAVTGVGGEVQDSFCRYCPSTDDQESITTVEAVDSTDVIIKSRRPPRGP